jgi:carbon storage regulator
MLILSRKLNEKVVIGDGVVVSIIEIRGDQVKLGIDAPKTVKVYRQEVYDAIQDENRLAAAGSTLTLPPIELPR